MLVDRHVSPLVQDQKLGLQDRGQRFFQAPAGIGFR
jgi:hypothetical protein